MPDVRATHFAKKVADAEEILRLLQKAAIVETHKNSVFADGHLSSSSPAPLQDIVSHGGVVSCLPALSSRLPDSILLADTTDGFSEVTRVSTRSLIEKRTSALDIIRKSQQNPKRERTWGLQQTPKTFTRNAKQKILEAGAVVERLTDPGDQYECTLTIPGSGWRVYDVVSRWSGYLINRMTQVIRRFQSQGVPVYWFFVWEHQKRGALHSHWCIAVPGSPMIADYVARSLKDQWYKCLFELSDKEGVDLFASFGYQQSWRNSPQKWQWKVVPVRKSVAAYFSKYCSKGVSHAEQQKLDRAEGDGADFKTPRQKALRRLANLCPSRYWGCSSSVKKECQRLTVEIKFEVDSREEADAYMHLFSVCASMQSSPVSRVYRDFVAKDDATGFVYCEGYEHRLWFASMQYDSLFACFKRISLAHRKTKNCLPILLDSIDEGGAVLLS